MVNAPQVRETAQTENKRQHGAPPCRESESVGESPWGAGLDKGHMVVREQSFAHEYAAFRSRKLNIPVNQTVAMSAI